MTFPLLSPPHDPACQHRYNIHFQQRFASFITLPKKWSYLPSGANVQQNNSYWPVISKCGKEKKRLHSNVSPPVVSFKHDSKPQKTGFHWKCMTSCPHSSHCFPTLRKIEQAQYNDARCHAESKTSLLSASSIHCFHEVTTDTAWKGCSLWGESEKGLTCGNREAFAARNSWPTYTPRCLTNQPHIMQMSKALAYRQHNVAKAPRIEQLESVARCQKVFISIHEIRQTSRPVKSSILFPSWL